MKVVSANESFYETFKLTKSDIEGEKIYSIANDEWNISQLRNLLEGILQKNRAMSDFEFEHNFTGIGHKKMLLNARIIYRADIDTEMILLAMEDKR